MVAASAFFWQPWRLIVGPHQNITRGLRGVCATIVVDCRRRCCCCSCCSFAFKALGKCAVLSNSLIISTKSTLLLLIAEFIDFYRHLAIAANIGHVSIYRKRSALNHQWPVAAKTTGYLAIIQLVVVSCCRLVPEVGKAIVLGISAVSDTAWQLNMAHAGTYGQ